MSFARFLCWHLLTLFFSIWCKTHQFVNTHSLIWIHSQIDLLARRLSDDTRSFSRNHFNTQLNLQPDKKPKKVIVTALSRHLWSRNIWRDKVINKTGCGQGYMKKGRVLLEAAKAGYLSDWDNKVGSFCNRAETKTRHDKIVYVYHRTLRLRRSLRLTHRGE